MSIKCGRKSKKALEDYQRRERKSQWIYSFLLSVSKEKYLSLFIFTMYKYLSSWVINRSDLGRWWLGLNVDPANTPLKLEGGNTPSLEITSEWRTPDKGLVIISTNWVELKINFNETKSEFRQSQTKWQSISMCLVCSWNIEFLAICKAAWLSQNMGTGVVIDNPRSPTKRTSQEISAKTLRRARYSASVEDKEIVGLFLIFQEIRLPPRFIKKIRH